MSLVKNEQLADVYAEMVRRSGREPGAGALDPFGKTMKSERDRLIRLASRADRDEEFIARHYRWPLNRLILHYMEEVELSYSLGLNYNSWGTDLQMYVTCDKLAEVLPVLRLLAAEGLRITDRPTKTEGTTKTWRLFPREQKLCDDEGLSYPKLTLYVSAKTCKQVQVGTKEVPVFETHCDWGEDEGGAELLEAPESAVVPAEDMPF